MHKILRLPELLNEIFSYLPLRTNAVTVQVCRLWFIHSVPFVWDTVNLTDALKVLSPFGVGLNDLGFQLPLSSQSWDRFLLYSRNVRQLQCYQIPYNALRQTVLWKPCVDLFSPKLTVLQWHGLSRNIEYLLPLLTSTLQILHLKLDAITNPHTINILYNINIIPLRSPFLHVFEIAFPPMDNHTSHEAVSQSLGKLLSPLSKLIILAIPIHCMTEELFTSLSRLPNLEGLSLLPSWVLDFRKIYVEELLERQLEDNGEAVKCSRSFDSLRKLDIADPASENAWHEHGDETFTMARVLGTGIHFINLTELTCCPHKNIHQFITLANSVHEIFPNVQKMTITYAGKYDLPWEAIHPLLQCPALIELRSENNVWMELDDIVTIATNRKSWKVVVLPSPEPLSYQALIIFAQSCPNLVELGLTLNSDLGFPHIKTSPMIKFSALTLLNVGDSTLTPEFMMEASMFLSIICGKSLKIRSGDEASSMWMAVEKLVILQLKNQGLEDEIALLRTRSEDLTERG